MRIRGGNRTRRRRGIRSRLMEEEIQERRQQIQVYEERRQLIQVNEEGI
jgi:hypothetical protein